MLFKVNVIIKAIHNLKVIHYQCHAQYVMSRQMSGVTYCLGQLSRFVYVLDMEHSFHVEQHSVIRLP